MTDPLDGRLAVVTGATDGIGLRTATGLARLGAQVVVTGRDPARAARAVDAIAREAGVPSSRVSALTADLSSFAEVRRLAAAVTERHLRVDVLVNNVGGLYTERWETVDGIEASLAVNALAPTLLTSLLRPALAAAAPSRVVYVTGGFPRRVDLGDLQNRRGYLGIRAYSHAKAVLVALAREQALQWAGSGIAVNVVYPGGANTPMTQAMTPATMPAFVRPLWPVFRLMSGRLTAERASRSSVLVASDPAYESVTDAYVKANLKRGAWPKDAQSDDVRAALARAAQELTGVRVTA